jgi:hypothetical protein
MLFDQLFELSSRNKLENLLENATESLRHRATSVFRALTTRFYGDPGGSSSLTLHSELFWTGVMLNGE